MSAVAELWAKKCEHDGVNFNRVPAKLKDEVREIIEGDGYIILDDGTVVKKEPEA